MMAVTSQMSHQNADAGTVVEGTNSKPLKSTQDDLLITLKGLKELNPWSTSMIENVTKTNPSLGAPTEED